MNDPATIKIVLYTSLAVCSLAGTALGAGIWVGKKNSDSEEINKMKESIRKNEDKSKERLYGKDGIELYRRAVKCDECRDGVRAVQKETDDRITILFSTQHKQELTLQKISGDIEKLGSNIELVLNFVKK